MNIQKLLDEVDWKEIASEFDDDEIPVATHEGILRIPNCETGEDIQLKVFQLSNGTRVIEQESLDKFFGTVLWRTDIMKAFG